MAKLSNDHKYWRYVGPGNGRGIVHQIIPSPVRGWICTWSLVPSESPYDLSTDGYSWFGPNHLFHENFEAVDKL